MNSSTSSFDLGVEQIRHQTPSSYLRVFTLVAACGLLLVAAFNFVIDPYRIYRVVEWPWVEGRRNTLDSRTAKAEALRHGSEHGDWKGLILGLSRAEFAINPEHPGFAGMPTFNGALLGCDMYELDGVFRTAVEHNDIRKVVMFCEFYMFNQEEHGHADYFKSRFYPGRNPLLYHIEALTSITATEASLQTIRRARRSNPGETLANGFRPRESAVKRWDHATAFERELQRFVKKGSTYRTYRYAGDAKSQDSAFHGVDLKRGEVDYRTLLERILDTCHDRDIELHLAISPTHATLLEGKSLVGAWDLYKAWKRDLVAIVARDAASHPNDEPFDLWDFSGFDGFHNEPIASGEDPAAMQFWWEVSHYRQQVGDAILSRILGSSYDGPGELRSIGLRLTASNIEQHLAAVDDQGRKWRDENPDLVEWVRRINAEQMVAKYVKNPGREW